MLNKFRIFLCALTVLVGAHFSYAENPDKTIGVVNGKIVVIDELIQPQITIAGAEQPYNPGTIATLNAEVTNYASDYVKEIEYLWNSEKSFRQWSGKQNEIDVILGINYKFVNNQLVILKDEFNVEVVVNITYEIDEKIVIKTVKKSQKVVVSPIGPPEPEPEPDPIPPPIPDPDISQTTQKTMDWFDKVNLTPDKKSIACLFLEDNFNLIANKISNKEIVTPTAILLETQKLNRELSLQNNIDPELLRVFMTPLQEYLWEEYNAGRLTQVDQYEKYWKDIAKGLELYNQ